MGVQAGLPGPLSTHSPPEPPLCCDCVAGPCADVSPGAVPVSELGCLLCCSPVSSGADPGPCRALVSSLRGCGSWCLGASLGGVAVGGDSAGSCCCREVAVGPGPVAWQMSAHAQWRLSSTGASGLTVSVAVASCAEHSCSSVSLGKPLSLLERFGQGCAPSCVSMTVSGWEKCCRCPGRGWAQTLSWRRHWDLWAEPPCMSSHFSWLLSGHRLTLTASRSSWRSCGTRRGSANPAVGSALPGWLLSTQSKVIAWTLWDTHVHATATRTDSVGLQWSCVLELLGPWVEGTPMRSWNHGITLVGRDP